MRNVAILPQRYEHLMSYLARTSFANHLSSLSDLYSECGISEQCKTFSLTDFDLQRSILARIADGIGIDCSLLTDLIPNFESGYCFYLNLKLPRDVITFENVRCCPRCLKESGKIASYYSLRPISMCLKHRSRLAEAWLDGSPIEWGDNNLYERICDGDFASPELSWEQEELNIHLGRLLNGQYTKTLAEQFGLMDAANFLTLLLFCFNHRYRSCDIDDSHYWSECYQTLRNTPLNIFEFFEILESNGQGMTFRNFAAIYPDMYSDLYRGSFSSSFAYMKLQQLLESNLSGQSHD